MIVISFTSGSQWISLVLQGAVATMGMDESLFSREARRFCNRGSKPPGLAGPCANFIGIGNCVDSSGQFFPYCESNSDMTLEACHKAATDASNALGFEFVDKNTCLLLFSSSVTFTCPAGFTADSNSVVFGGTDAVTDINDTVKNLVCYACQRG